MELGKKATPGPNWNKGSTTLLYGLIQQKFSEEKRGLLLAKTGQIHLYECTFHPIYGVGRHLGNVHTLSFDKVKGGNMLGRLLEKVRTEVVERMNKAKCPETNDEKVEDHQPTDAAKTDEERLTREVDDQKADKKAEKNPENQPEKEKEDVSSDDDDSDENDASDLESQPHPDETDKLTKASKLLQRGDKSPKRHTPILNELDRAQLLKELIEMEK